MGKNLFIYFFTLLCSLTNLFSNELRARGYSLIPAPQQTYIKDGDVRIDNNWGIENLIGSNSIALNRLIEGAKELHNLDFNGNGAGKISLEIIKTPLFENLNAKRLNEAYQIKILPEKVKIVANAEAGIFYGVQSLLQLLKPVHGGAFVIPIGTINDWPDTELRVIHWDTKHHQDRVGT
ncbi:MAG: glycoside hydrolase family 20 zincin-like fold domain-containing protein, partial [Allomuricauda sp.]